MLYHVSFERIPNQTLYARIPRVRTFLEEDKTPRISMSTSIEKCITSMPDGITAAEKMIKLLKDTNLPAVLYVYTIDETSIEPKELLLPSEIVDNVPDAVVNQEYWILSESIKCTEHVIKVDMIKYKDIEVDIIGRTKGRVITQLQIASNLAEEDYVENVLAYSIDHFSSLKDHYEILDVKEGPFPKTHIAYIQVRKGQSKEKLWEVQNEALWSGILNAYAEEQEEPLTIDRRTLLANFNIVP